MWVTQLHTISSYVDMCFQWGGGGGGCCAVCTCSGIRRLEEASPPFTTVCFADLARAHRLRRNTWNALHAGAAVERQSDPRVLFPGHRAEKRTRLKFGFLFAAAWQLLKRGAVVRTAPRGNDGRL